ncbi:MAG: sigma-54 dependent transcriptional regulator, partial [Mucispirillum sp.]|nr:sigma-54 dependent transcriptional regulator [Mucispirillum sp.]
IHYLDIKNEGGAAQSPVKKLVGVSASMQNIFKMIAKIAETNATVLITGESGNGKQVIAETIHSLSQRKGRFVQTNCCGIPETLIESEMFGFTKGSFSGAIASKKGKFELSDKGSIFLDEIGELPKNMQGKLLHVLQEREITPIGAYEPLKLDLRIIAATNKDLESMVQNGSFRLDLFHRLKIIHIHVPPLRERIDDIEPLIIHFTEMFAHKYNVAAPPIDKKVMEWAKSYSWPGNIREMRNLIEREILLDNGILYENIIAHFEQNYAQGAEAYDESAFEDETLSSAVNKFERHIIERTLMKYDGNRSRSAKALGISRRALLYKIKEYNIN